MLEVAPGFASVQNQYSILYREPEDEVLPYCERPASASFPTSRWPAAC